MLYFYYVLFFLIPIFSENRFTEVNYTDFDKHKVINNNNKIKTCHKIMLLKEIITTHILMIDIIFLQESCFTKTIFPPVLRIFTAEL